MEFRIEKTVVAFLIAASGLIAQPFSAEVRHKHLHGAGAGTVRIDIDGIVFTESGKKAEYSHTWKFFEIQRLTLSEDRLRIITYDDVRWQLGRDREYSLEDLPEHFASDAHRFLKQFLDQRYVAALAEPDLAALWQLPAKLLKGYTGGASGMLSVTADSLIFETGRSEQSRTWRIADIQNISSASPYDLTLATFERAEVRLQLKQSLPEARYNELWRQINEAQGLRFLKPSMENHHD